jgi:hypothetical protein
LDNREKINEKNKFQNVQRLNKFENDSNKLRALWNSISYDETILKQRDFLIKKNLTKGNNKDLNSYKQKLPDELPKFAVSWCIGLILSDATIQRNTSNTNKTFRLKLQQVSYNIELLEKTVEILKPWIFGFHQVSTRETMFSLATIQHKAFNIFETIFQNSQIEMGGGDCVTKIIPENIIEYLDPLAVAIWFCGDGGKRDYGKNQGKAIQFATHGFSKQCNERLALALREKYKWKVEVKFDYTNEKDQDFYLLQVEAESYDSFRKYIVPYILNSFLRKVPSPRAQNSRFSQIVEELNL